MSDNASSSENTPQTNGPNLRDWETDPAGMRKQVEDAWVPFIPGTKRPSAERLSRYSFLVADGFGQADPRDTQKHDLEILIGTLSEIDAPFPSMKEWEAVTEPHRIMHLNGEQIDVMRSFLFAKFKKWEIELFEDLISAGYFGNHWPLQPHEHKALWEKAREARAEGVEREEYEIKFREVKRLEKARRQAKKDLDAEEAAEQLSSSDADSRVIRGGSILDEPEGVPAIWGQDDKVLWAQGQGIMIASQQGVGKTTLAQQLVLHRIGILGDEFENEFLGYRIKESEGGVTVYLAMDRPQQALGSFRRMVTEEDRSTLDAQLVIRKGPLPVDALGKTTALADYLQLIAPDCDTVVIDSVKDMAGGRSLSADDVGAAINSAVQECLARGIEVLLLHHQRKAQNGSERFNSLDDVFGSTLITSGLGSVFALKGTPGCITPELIHLKQPAMPVEMTLRHDHTTGTTRVEDGAVECIDIIRERGEAGITLAELAQRRLGRAEKTDTQKIGRELKKYIESRQVRKVPGDMAPTGRQPDRYVINTGVDRLVGGSSDEQ